MSMSNNTRNHQDPKFLRSKRRSKSNGAGDLPTSAPSQPSTAAPTAGASSSSTSMPTNTPAASPFQNIFDNVCRCFGHVPASSPTTSFPPPPGSNTAAAAAAAVSSGSSSSQQQQQQQHNGQLQDGQKQQQPTRTTPSSRETKKRTERLELRGREYDELFTGKDENGVARRKNHPPRPEQHDPYSTKSSRSRGRGGSSRETSSSTSGDVEIAHAVAQAKLAANPPRYGGNSHNNGTYRSKRKRSPTQIRDDIFRNINSMKTDAVSGREQQQSSVRDEGAKNNGANGRDGKSTNGVGGIPQPDFSRLLNPSLALCFATPIRGTEEEDEAASDVKSLGSDTNTLNTNGDDTITSTLYFDSKYAHIHETRPPMPLFNQFKVGMESDEIRNIVATDSHSSMKMMKLLQEQEQEQQRRDAAASTQDGDDHAMSDNEEISTASKRSNADSNSSSNGRKGSRNIHDDPATVSTRLDPRASDGRLHQQQPNHRHIQSMSTIVQSNQRYPLNNSSSDSKTKGHRLQHNPHAPSTTATTTSDSGYDDGDVDMT